MLAGSMIMLQTLMIIIPITIVQGNEEASFISLDAVDLLAETNLTLDTSLLRGVKSLDRVLKEMAAARLMEEEEQQQKKDGNEEETSASSRKLEQMWPGQLIYIMASNEKYVHCTELGYCYGTHTQVDLAGLFRMTIVKNGDKPIFTLNHHYYGQASIGINKYGDLVLEGTTAALDGFNSNKQFEYNDLGYFNGYAMRSLANNKFVSTRYDAGAKLKAIADTGVKGSWEEYRSRPATTFTAQIVVLHSWKCLDLKDGSSSNGAQIQQWDCYGGDNQIFTFQLNELYEWNPIKTKWYEACFDVEGQSKQNGANVHQWDCANYDSQKFKYHQVYADHIQNKNSEKCLDIAGVSMDNGALLTIYDCLINQKNQKFRLFPREQAIYPTTCGEWIC